MTGDTGDMPDPRIASALHRADELAVTSPHEHVAIYEDVHETLQQVLADAGAAEPANDETDEAQPGDAQT